MAGEWLAIASLVLALVVVLLALLASALLLFKGPRNALSRFLAAILVLDALMALGVAGMASFGVILTSFDSEGWLPRAMEVAYIAGMFVAPALFPPLMLLFLGRALDTPLVRPLRHPVTYAVLWILVVFPLVDLSTRTYGEEPPLIYPMPEIEAQLFFVALVSLYGLAAAGTSLVRADPGSPQRARARAFLLAFGVRDAAWFLVLIVAQWVLLYQSSTPGYEHAFGRVPGLYSLLPLASLAFLILLAVGVLRTHLLGLEVRVRRAVARGAVGVFFLLVVALAAGLSERWLEQYNVVAGGLAAGVLLLFLHPLQRLGERLASFAIPGGAGSEHRSSRDRRRVYMQHLEIAWGDGILGLKERKLLEGLRVQLGLSVDEAHRLEEDVTNRRRPSGDAPA